MDIVERLRTQPPILGRSSDTQILRNEAASEIEQLRAALYDLYAWYDEEGPNFEIKAFKKHAHLQPESTE